MIYAARSPPLLPQLTRSLYFPLSWPTSAVLVGKYQHLNNWQPGSFRSRMLLFSRNPLVLVFPCYFPSRPSKQTKNNNNQEAKTQKSKRKARKYKSKQMKTKNNEWKIFLKHIDFSKKIKQRRENSLK